MKIYLRFRVEESFHKIELEVNERDVSPLTDSMFTGGPTCHDALTNAPQGDESIFLAKEDTGRGPQPAIVLLGTKEIRVYGTLAALTSGGRRHLMPYLGPT